MILNDDDHNMIIINSNNKDNYDDYDGDNDDN